MGKYFNRNSVSSSPNGFTRICSIYDRSGPCLAIYNPPMKTEINLLSPQAIADRRKLILSRRINAIEDALLVCLLLIVASYGAAYWVFSKNSAALGEQGNSNEEEYQRMEQEFRTANILLSA